MSDFDSRARFVRLNNGDVFARTPLLESAKTAVLVSDAEARAYFEAAGADLNALGLADVVSADPDPVPHVEPVRPVRRKKVVEAIVADAPIDIEALLNEES